MDWIDKMGLVVSIVLPMWNIPLILRVIKRKSSEDISLQWALGVWICFVLMFPSAMRGNDLIFKAFSISNIILFSAVVFVVLKYRKKKET